MSYSEFEFIQDIVLISELAGKKTLEVYNSKEISIFNKFDNSPLTKADLISHEILVSNISKITPNIPIVSEENAEKVYKFNSDIFWCIDPLDGTKEFLNKNGEFTVNIALVKKNKPILGIITIPTTGETYYAMENKGAFFKSKNLIKKIEKQKNNPTKPIKFAVSRSHISENTLNFVNLNKGKMVISGSSLKFLKVALGEVDAYPRFGKTSIWDVAAGHAIILETGGDVIDFNKNSLSYNYNEIINPNFIALKHKSLKFIYEN